MDELPVRQLSRFSSELHLSGIDAAARLAPGSGDDAIVALVALRTCLPDWMARGRPSCPPVLRLGTTLHALARTLDRPVGSIQGYVARLVRDGLIDRGVPGLFVPPSAAARVVPFLEEVHDLLLRLARDVHGAGVLFARRGCAAVHPAQAVIGTGPDMLLMPFETFRGQLGDWTAKKLWIAASTLAVRRITCDPELSRRFAVASTPDAERRAVPAARLRAVTRTSTATAWRRLKAMEAAGVMAQRDGGWLVRSDQLLEAEMEASVRASVDYYLRRLNELVAAGLDAADPRYLRGQPPLVAEGWPTS